MLRAIRGEWGFFLVASTTAFLLSFHAHSQTQGKKLSATFDQLTMPTGAVPEVSDPAPPYITSEGHIQVFGSGSYYIEYPDWKTYEAAGAYQIAPLHLHQPDGTPIWQGHDQAWDIRKWRVLTPQGNGKNFEEEIYLAGLMTAPDDRGMPEWPRDNASRRIFLIRNGVRSKQPLVGHLGSGFIDHSYGGNYFQPGNTNPNIILNDGKTPLYLSYEKVTEVKNGFPWKTEIFLQKMLNISEAADTPPIKIMSVEKAGDAALRSRSMGGALVEGARIIQVLGSQGSQIYLLSFSASDFCTDSYTMSFGYSHDLENPEAWKVLRTPSGGIDFGKEIKENMKLSWLGRPALYFSPADGHLELLFHAVEKSAIPNNDYSDWPHQHQLWDFYRNIYRIRDIQFIFGTKTQDPLIKMDPFSFGLQANSGLSNSHATQ